MGDDLHDVHQMSGEVLLTSSGAVQWMHVKQEGRDRPSADDVLVRIRAH